MADTNRLDALDLDAARTAHHARGALLSRELAYWFRLMAIALLLALVVRTLVVQPFSIPSQSMAPGLEAGDYVFVNKTAYGWTSASFPFGAANAAEPDPTGAPRRWFSERLMAREPKLGDVIVFVGPNGTGYVKRVVARGGDRVAMLAGKLIVNGDPVPCEAAGDGLCREALAGASFLVRPSAFGPLSDFGPLVVPEGQYFVLGDNRGASADSRLPRALGGVGLVSDADVIGRAQRIFFAVDDDGVRWDRLWRPIR